MASTPSFVYAGYSTANTEQTGIYQLYDIELVRQDLLNHFMTRIGERVGRPTWGCGIWDRLMDLNTPDAISYIESECARVVNDDTRCSLQNVQVNTYENGVQVTIDALYAPWNVVDTFTATFDATNGPQYTASAV